MSDIPVQLIVAAFQDEKMAKNALDVLKDGQRQKLIKIDNAAVLRKDAKGRLWYNKPETRLAINRQRAQTRHNRRKGK